MKGFTGSGFLRLTLLAVAVICAFFTISYKTPVAVAVGSALLIAGLAAAPLEVSSFGLCVVGSILEGVSNAAHAAQQLAVTCAAKLNPDMVKRGLAIPQTTSCFGDEDHHVFLEIKGFDVSESAARKLVLHAYDECRSLAAIQVATNAVRPVAVTPTNQINADTKQRAPESSAA